MYTLDSTFKSEKNKESNQPIYIYTLHDYDGAGSNLYFAECDTHIDYDNGDGTGSHQYDPFPIKHDEIGENSGGEIDAFRVTVANVNRFIQAYLELYDLRGKKMTIMLVWANQLADTSAHIKFIFHIDTYTVSETAAEFTLTSRYDVQDCRLPTGSYSRNFCRWKFKSTECGYTTPQTACDKRKTTCKAVMLNIARYGAFPGTPMFRIFT